MEKNEIAEQNQGDHSDTTDHEGLDHKPVYSDADEGEVDVFGGEGGANFRTMGRFDTVFALLTNQFGLGALALPSVFKTLGLIPGLITLIGGALITYFSGVEIFWYYVAHPKVTNIAEMMKIVGGRPAEIFCGIGLLLQLIMTAASAVVTISIALNAISEHAVCTVGYIAIACILCFMLCIPRTAKFLAQSGLPCILSILAAALSTIIGLGIKNPPGAPEGWKPEIELFGTPTLREVLNGVLKILFALAGNYAFVTYMAEMKDPKKDFIYSLRWLMVASVVFYAFIAIAVYCLAAEFTSSPALSSAPIVAAKVAYGLVLPAILTDGLACGHIGTKYVYITIMRQINALKEVTANTPKAWGTWIGSNAAFWVIVFILSNTIPVFDSIVAVSSATTYAWFTYGISAFLWLHLYKGRYFEDWWSIMLFIANIGFIVFSLFLNGGGTWSSITALLDIFATSDNIRGCFSCGDNAVI
ncbi:uncharacterized protein NECHADRAFT_36802 [Fusarium vanettenii 77-13-4]|uniref:Amino acid transporter transmembrane domain-containing protein n=1 Tax=Fusarium vanettenii (strain ATCC MYA-4622 / CBS 123669 / FGSC 9596 / NRRL 45880 / 77-13-4) TaxID=660122 RepID=C7YKY4_FUSV7|nr:uncharacterized protein NECHADRAFT_36802 [Fusarium vanettenii 77-13-4]EEU46700.1 hypothetical protein NECHADRAFT_36802 [Fusarium vanettenii 77-13-4]